MNRTGLINCSDVSFFYPDSRRTILDRITWDIGPGERWVLFGPNGSGKTKLLEVICGYLYPSAGSVVRFGTASGMDVRDARRRIGYVSTPMKERFYRDEPTVDVVISGSYASVGLYDEPGPGEKRRARGLLDAAGLGDRTAQRFGTLSDGEKQKVIMLRAVMAAPELLILDEPAMGLDLPAREDFLSSMESLCAGNAMAVVYVTHYVEEITPFFNKIFMLKNGGCWFSGTVEEGLSEKTVSGLFDRDIAIMKRAGRYFAALA